jgi:hypothetical protein
MSGGRFGSWEHSVEEIIEDLERIVKMNEVGDFSYTNENGETNIDYNIGYKYPADVLQRMNETINALKYAKVLVKRFDYLLEGDDSVDSFRKRIEEDLIEAGLPIMFKALED